MMMGSVFFCSKICKLKKIFTKNIEYIEGGISGMNLLHLLPKFDTIMLIDADEFKGKSGDVRVFSLNEIRSLKTSNYSHP